MLKYATVPVEVIPLKRAELQARGVYTRAQDPKQTTEFTYCRFFVPYLNNYKGTSLPSSQYLNILIKRNEYPG